MLLILLHPGGADLDVRADGRQPPPGLGDLRARCCRCSSPRVAIVYVAEASDDARACTPPALDRRQHGGQGAALRHRLDSRSGRVTTVASCGAVNAAMESLTGIGGAVPMAQHDDRRGDLRRRRLGPLRDAAVRPAAVFLAGLMVGRTPEYLGKKIEAREIKLVVARRRSPCRSSCSSRRALAIATKWGAPSIFNAGPAGLLRDALRLHLAGQQQRLGVRRLHRLRPARRRRTPARSASRSPTCSAAWRCSSAASCRCSPCWRSPARWRASTSPRPAPDDAHRHADVRRPAHRRRPARRAPHLRPRPAPRPGRPGPHRPALLTARAQDRRDRRRRPHASLLGLAYPLAMTGVAQVAFPGKADGSIVSATAVVGSRHRPGLRSDPAYFQCRPSATGLRARRARSSPTSGPTSRTSRDQLEGLRRRRT